MIENAIGIKAMDGDVLVGVCTTAAYAIKHNEIDIMVDREYRKQGIGYAIAYTFIKECYKRGEKPGWDCVSHNEPSKALATKLGFKQAGSYKLLEW
jgi:RimJ/RimL family protein N-acetyltransferase